MSSFKESERLANNVNFIQYKVTSLIEMGHTQKEMGDLKAAQTHYNNGLKVAADSNYQKGIDLALLYVASEFTQ